MFTRENHYKRVLEQKKWRDVSLKFVKFEKNDDEDFIGPEKEDEDYDETDTKLNGTWVSSQYFERFPQLGDFEESKRVSGPQCGTNFKTSNFSIIA